MTDTLEIRLLGSFQVTRAASALVGFESNKVRALLAYLSVETDRSHSRRKLAGLLWPDLPESTALSNLRYALSNLRSVISDRSIRPAYLEIGPQELRFNPSSNSLVDAREFESFCISAQYNPLDFDSLEKAAELYQGRFLEGFAIPDSSAFEEWFVLKREHLDRLAIQVFGMLANDHELAGEFQQSIQFTERQLELDPWREEAHRRLMRCLYFTGQRSAAMAQYEACRRELADELSVEPELETRQLYRQMYEEKLTAPPTPPAFLRHSEPSRVERSRFVSRQGPLNRLHQCLERAIAGQGQLMLITGNPGQGKTALVHEFIHQALQTHASLAAAWGNSHAYFGSGDPYLPFRAILEMLTGQVEHQWEAGSISQAHALRMWRLTPYSIKALVQEGPALIGTFIAVQSLQQRASLVIQNQSILSKSVQSLVTRQSGGPPTAQQDLFLQYGRVLSSISRQIPLILFVDDLQWADQSSLSLLFHLSRELKSTHILLIGSFRPLEDVSRKLDKNPSLATMVNELRLLYGDVLIDLDEQENRDFIDAYLDLEPNQLSETFRQDLFRYTHSHPLFTIEMLYGMQERGDLIKNPQGEWIISPSLSWGKLPPKVEAVIAERLRQLPPPLRDLLKAASIEGERFTAEILAKMLVIDEDQVLLQLNTELDPHYKLVQAESIKYVNETRISRYRFRHILYQRYIYSQLNLIERARLHEQAGTSMEVFYGSMLDEIAVQLAVHFELANSPLKAIHYLNIAGIQAAHLSGFEDAINHLRKALSLLEMQPESLDKDLQELELLNNLVVPLMISRGYAAPDLGILHTRQAQLLIKVPFKPEMLPTIMLMCSYYLMRADYQKMMAIMMQVEHIAENIKDEFIIHFMDFGYGHATLWLGKPKEALPHFEQMINFYDQSKYGQMHNIIGSDLAIDSLCWGSWTLWLLGYSERAAAYGQQAVDLGLALKDPSLQTVSQVLTSFLHVLMKDATGVSDLLQSSLQIMAQHPMPLPSSDLEFVTGYYKVLIGETEIGLASMIRGTEAYQVIGTRMALSLRLTLLADAHLHNNQTERAAQFIKQAEDFIAETGEKFYLAETLRVKGETLLLQNTENSEEAEDLFCQALQVAHAQSAKSLELRAAMSLARLRQKKGRLAEARQVLAPVYDWFTEGFGTPDLQEAQALLNSLA